MTSKRRLRQIRTQRRRRVRSNMVGTAERPRLSVNRSNRFISVQAIDDQTGVTLASASDYGQGPTKSKAKKVSKIESAQAVAKALATALKKKKITKAVFDRGQYRYHGRVKAIAETLREGGISL